MCGVHLRMHTAPKEKDCYFIQMATTGYIKVGRSGNPLARLDQLQTGAPHTLRLLFILPGQGNKESMIHRILRRYQVRVMKGEWFREDCLGELPLDLYNQIPETVLEDSDWWKTRR